MNTVIEKFYVIGISIRTQNLPGKAEKDIPQLWNEFIAKDIQSKISNLLSTDIYCIYTDYEGDFSQPYTTILGYKVDSLDTIPEGLSGWAFETDTYKVFTAQGKMSDGFVYGEWVKIWNMDLRRSYKADFEIYSSGSRDMEKAEVNIFISIKE